jgi:hypothetical protein
MTLDCTNFHFVLDSEICQNINTQYNISFIQFLAWNPSVGSSRAACGSTHRPPQTVCRFPPIVQFLFSAPAATLQARVNLPLT